MVQLTCYRFQAIRIRIRSVF
ncbi:hypothetical protein QTP86_024016 [Hemibagrus guttatus]|nr:hypothetical protein QTP86_024016 [Hemibagrus guttatus]